MKVGLSLCVLFFILCNLAWAGDPADRGNPDTVYLECGGVTGGILNIKVRIVTDNIGDSNRIVAIGVPLEITNSNPAAKPVLDTTLGATFSGTAVEAWTSRSVYVVSNDRNPSIFPVKVGVSSLTFDYSLALRAGRYLFANVKIRLQDTTPICVDTFSYAGNKIRFTPITSRGYTPQWRGICCQVDSSDLTFSAGDVNCSGNVNLTDVLYLANYVYKSGPAPCLDRVGDVNCSGGLANLSDIIYLVNYLFKGGPAPVSCP